MVRYSVLIVLAVMATVGCSSPQNQLPLIVAHRGASWYAPENTIPAFLLAWEQGADAIEGDFFLTADGEIVCIHDSHTGRVADTRLVVAESTLEELRQLDVGSWKGAEWEGTRMPTIAEVFAVVPADRKIFVEIKPGTEILPKLYEEIERSGLRPEQIVLISFNSEVVREFKKVRPDIRAYWLSGFREDEDGNIQPGIERILETLENTGADGFSSNFGRITPEMIQQVFDAGYEYHVWTVNDGQVARDFTNYGTLSITTDRPGYIRDHISREQ